MSCQIVSTDKAPAAIGPYSQGVRSAGFLFVSGQLGLVPGTGEMVGGELEEQSEQALRNLKEVLAAGGCQITDVVSVDVFLRNMGQFGAFNAVYERFFSTHKPARAVVEVSGLPRGALVEIKCIAHVHS